MLPETVDVLYALGYALAGAPAAAATPEFVRYNDTFIEATSALSAVA